MSLISHLLVRATWAGSFQYRDFRFLWGATVLHSMGFGMEQVALGWLVLEMTDSPFMVGMSMAARMAPLFFLGILSGAVADRVDRRIFLRFITLGGSVAAGGMAVILYLDVVQVWHVMTLAVATGCIWAFVMTVRQAYTFDIVGPEKAMNGLALNSMSMQVGGIVGSILAGVLIDYIGMAGQYVAVAATSVAATATLLATRHAGQAASRELESVLRSLLGYISLIRQNRTLMTLMMLAAATEIFGFSHMSLLPVFARDVLGVGAVGLGLMTAVRQVGGMLGLIALANLGDFERKGQLMFALAIAFGLGQIAFSVSAGMVFFLFVLAFVNGCAMTVDTLYKTLMQSNVPNEQRGRAMGAWALSIGTGPLGHLNVGAMASAFGAPGALLINGGVLAFVGIATAIGLPRIRRLS